MTNNLKEALVRVRGWLDGAEVKALIARGRDYDLWGDDLRTLVDAVAEQGNAPTVDKQREKFETWAADEKGGNWELDDGDLKRGSDGDYMHRGLSNEWKVWLAALAANNLNQEGK